MEFEKGKKAATHVETVDIYELTLDIVNSTVISNGIKSNANIRESMKRGRSTPVLETPKKSTNVKLIR